MHLVDITMFYPAETGGVRTYLSAKAHWLARRTRIDHTIVAPAWADSHNETGFISLPSVPIPYSRGYRMPTSVAHAVNVLDALQPDLIEVGDPYQLAWSVLRAKRALQVPAVAFYHSDLPQLAGQRYGAAAQLIATRYICHLYRQFDLVLTPSALLAQRLRNLGIPRVHHQPLGVDTTVFSDTNRNLLLRRQLGLPKDTRLLIYAGRFTREKKLPLLIEAVERLGAPYHLIMVGSGGGGLPSSSQVSYLPFQRDAHQLARLMASCDVFVHAGDQETFGLVVLEAMACGLPVIGPAAGGVAELIERDTGILTPPGNARALADAIRRIYQQDLAGLGANGRRKVCQKYDWNVVMPQLMRHYASLLAAHQRAELEAGMTYAIH